MNSEKALMHQADRLLEQIGKADLEGRSTDPEMLLSLSRQHLQVWQMLTDAGYVPTNTESTPWKWERLSTRRCCPSCQGSRRCSYHANKMRRLEQRLSHMQKIHNHQRSYSNSAIEQLTLSDIFSGLTKCFGTPLLGAVIWLVWFSSASFTLSMHYWTTLAYTILTATIVFCLDDLETSDLSEL